MSTQAESVRRDLIVLTLTSALLFLAGLGARDLWNPNEPLYGRAVAEMAEDGNWLFPTVNGEVFAEKPILYFWAARVSCLLGGGVREAPLRLPLALGAVGSVALLYLLVLPYAGAVRARLSAIAFATTYMVFWTARAVQMDSLVLAATLATILAVTRVLDFDADPRLGIPLAGLAAGLGFAAKGPVAVVCPGLVLLVYAATTGRWRRLTPPALLLGVLAFLAAAAPWYLALAVRGETELLHEVLVRQNFTRFVQPWDHQAPWWYYLHYFWIDMAPWALLVPLAFRLPAREFAERRLDLLAWIWIVGIVAFFSLSASKRSAYIVPVAPAVAVLASGVVERWLDGRLGRGRSRGVMTLLIAHAVLLFLLAGALHVQVAERYPLVWREARMAAWLCMVGGAAMIAGALTPLRRRSASGTAFAAFLPVFYLVAGVWLLPAVDVYKSARPFCEQVNTRVGPDEPLRSYGGWRWRAGYSYYTGRRIERVATDEELRAWWSDEEPGFLIVEEDGWEPLRRAIGAVEPVLQRRVGSREVALFAKPGSR